MTEHIFVEAWFVDIFCLIKQTCFISIIHSYGNIIRSYGNIAGQYFQVWVFGTSGTVVLFGMVIM